MASSFSCRKVKGQGHTGLLSFRMNAALLPAGLPHSGKLPVLFLLTGQKSGFSPRGGDLLHRFRSNFAEPTGTCVRFAVQNFMSISADGWECGPKISKNFHFLVKRGDSLDRFPKFLGAFIRLTILR